MRTKFSFIVFSLLILSCNSQNKVNSIEELEDKAYKAYELQDYVNSIKYFSQLLAEDSLNGSYYFGRGYSYSMLIEKDNAISDYLQSAKLEYEKGSCYYNVGILNAFLNDSVAIIYFSKAIKILPDRIDIKKKYNECLARLKATNR